MLGGANSLNAQDNAIGEAAGNNDSALINDKINNDRLDPFVSLSNKIERASIVYDSLIWEFNGIHNYHPLHSQYAHFQTIGDPGMPVALRFPYMGNNQGFHSGFDLYSPYLFTSENTQYYTAFAPFSRLAYTQMPKGFTLLEGIFTTNINPGWNASIRFRNTTNQGFYPRQRNSMSQAQMSSRYLSKGNRYYVQFSHNSNRFFNQENGGWENDSLFDILTGTSKQSTVNLNASESRFSYRNTSLEHVYWIKGRSKDTLDSNYIFIPRWGLKHRMDYSKTRSVFKSDFSDFSFLGSGLFDSIQTNDSFVFTKTVNEWGVVNFQSSSSRFSFFSGIGTEWLGVKYRAVALQNSPANNLFFKSEINYSLFSNVGSECIYYYYLSGFNKGDNRLFLKVKSKDNKDSSNRNSLFYHLSFESKRNTPGFVFHELRGNHREWNNALQAIQSQVIEAAMGSKSKIQFVAAKARIMALQNAVYLSKDIIPLQYHGSFRHLMLSFDSRFKLGPFYLKNEISFQSDLGSNMNEFLPFPTIMSYHSWYYQNDLFKNALKLQIGTDVRWFSSYYAPAYDPASRLFYLQDRRMQGNYPIVDFFVSGEIKTFRGFVKLEHANFALLDEQFPNLYYSTLNYSLVSRRMVLGVVWKLYN